MSSPWLHFDPGGRLLDDIGVAGPIAAAAVLALDYFLTSILAKELRRALRLSVALAWRRTQ